MSWEWLSQFLQVFADAVPRPLIIRTDERCIEFVFGAWPRELKAGWYIEWPLLAAYETTEIKRQTCEGLQRFGRKAFRWKIIYEIENALQLVTSTYDFEVTIVDFGEIALGSIYTDHGDDLLAMQAKIEEAIRHDLAEYGVRLIKFAIVSASEADRQFSIWELAK